MKSCETCPSYVPTEEVALTMGRPTGAPMCGRFGYVLGRPGMTEGALETAAVAFALKCDSYGEAKPDKPVTPLQSRVTNADPAVIHETGADDFTPDTLTSCRQCKFSVRPDVVASELGYPLDLCSAKGKLILRPQNECKGCPMASQGIQRTSTDGLEIRAEFRDGYTIPTEAAAAAVTSVGNTTEEPTTYPSDFPVSDADREDGIRAWRKIMEPGGTNYTVLPVFDPAQFTDEERALIPTTGDRNNPELYVDYDHKLYRFAVAAYKKGYSVALQGLPGLGKTEFGRWVAWLMQVPFYRFQFKKSSEVANILGETGVDESNGASVTAFRLGRLPLAYQRPAIILLDELNLAPPEIGESLRSVLDTGELVIDEASPSITVERNAYCFVIVAQNPAWDVRNRGAEELAAAEFSRLSPIHVDFPPDPVERHIISERCKVLDGYDIPKAKLDVIMAIAADLREASKAQTVPFSWGIREQIKVARFTEDFNMAMAFKTAVLDFYEPEVVSFCIKVISDHDPNTKPPAEDVTPF